MTSQLRPDGPAKLTGAAIYAADTQIPDVVHAALVTATVPNGRVVAIEKPDAPGVVAFVDHTNVGELAPQPGPPLGHVLLPLQSTEIHYDGQPVAVVLAETLEQAQHAASLTSVTYSDSSSPVVFGQAEQVAPGGAGLFKAPSDKKGDVDAGLASADKTVHATYTTADRHHSPIEPSATIAWWEGDQLTVHTSTQSSPLAQSTLAGLFQIPREHVRVICPYVGGGFGAKGYIWPHLILAVAAAKVSGRAVKLVMTRAQMFSLSGHQPATSQTITLGATADGKLTAIRHLSVNASARVGGYVESTTGAATFLYDSPNIETDLKIEALDKPQPAPMRAPAEGPGLFPLECAMDELAVELGIDPVELRLRNEPSVDPLSGKPFSSRKLVECLTEGAERFGWADRKPQMRDGNWQIGWGMAVATFGSVASPSAARVRVDSDGHVIVETDMQEIGSGLPAMVQIIAAETLGCEPSDVEVRHGDSSYPPHPGTFASLSSGSLSAAVQNAASSVMEKLQAQPGDSLADLVDAAGLEFVESEGSWAPAASRNDYTIKSFGAVFVEVRVDADLGVVRVPRIVGVYSAGRIINQVAAHSQMTGGIIWGLGQALLEQSVMEPRLGRFLSRNLAGYVVPVNADIGEIDVTFLEENDQIASPSGARGVGELGSCGIGPAIANAVFHATGKRVRSLPIKIHDLL
ncbi:xanthine dehydrogenase family protein molybdopterin-binding subunit [Kibdelosporangium philippinense]|uniref:Xanthine dehydrogenase family protein molybdopterin-binding subunit n=1 Tax=Kibdelosporangium philippinense TaxID=211113 RepID=A0ABS8ZEF7_9PSEU|nr:xanthine dehydrogenase family protein molybdopterin-binding subunit [Kibdelosporangium philippinense]MCE7006188.1 xanthine dehydrogenase family protein molybdopterin-binding subunit [Kibdelosporangium philippinense]